MKQLVPIFEGDIVNRKLKLFKTVKEAIARYCSTFPNGTRIDITFRKHKTKRTDLQNAYYWGVVVKILADHFGYDSEEMHEELKYLFNPIQSKINPQRNIGGSTTKLSTTEFYGDQDSYVEQICRWAAEKYGVYIPPPERIEGE